MIIIKINLELKGQEGRWSLPFRIFLTPATVKFAT
jgi:hypothetical protein